MDSCEPPINEKMGSDAIGRTFNSFLLFGDFGAIKKNNF